MVDSHPTSHKVFLLNIIRSLFQYCVRKGGDMWPLLLSHPIFNIFDIFDTPFCVCRLLLTPRPHTTPPSRLTSRAATVTSTRVRSSGRQFLQRGCGGGQIYACQMYSHVDPNFLHDRQCHSSLVSPLACLPLPWHHPTTINFITVNPCVQPPSLLIVSIHSGMLWAEDSHPPGHSCSLVDATPPPH